MNIFESTYYFKLGKLAYLKKTTWLSICTIKKIDYSDNNLKFQSVFLLIFVIWIENSEKRIKKYIFHVTKIQAHFLSLQSFKLIKIGEIHDSTGN
jgi:hypothetical protein